MPIDKKIFEELKEGFAYLEEYDKVGGFPDKKVPLCVTIPLRLKKRLKEQKNISKFVENAIEKALIS